MYRYDGPPQKADLIELGRRISAARLKKGLSREELAKQAQLSPSTVKNAELGRHALSAVTMAMLSKVLEDLDLTTVSEQRVRSIKTLAALLQQYSLPEQVTALILAGVDRQAFVVELLQRPEVPDVA